MLGRPALLGLALAACSGGDHGYLMPVATPGVSLVSTQGRPADTARLASGGVGADADATWTGSGETLELVYRAGPAPVTVPLRSASVWKDHRAVATGAWDTTRPAPGNAIGRPLLGTGGLRLAAHETRKMLIEYDRSPVAGGDRPGVGDDITIGVPMPGGAVPVRFRATGP